MDGRDKPGHDDVASYAMTPTLAFRQLQLDAAVALVGLFGGRRIQRLEFGKAGGDQPLCGHAERDQILHHRYRPRRGQFPVRLEHRAVQNRPDVGVAVDPQHPGDFRRNLFVELGQRGCELFQFGAALGQQQRLSGVEKYFGLEHKAVADDPDVRPVAQNRAQPPKKFRTVARQFLHPLRQRDVEALAEVGDLALRFLVALLRGAERFLEGGELAAQRTDLPSSLQRLAMAAERGNQRWAAWFHHDMPRLYVARLVTDYARSIRMPALALLVYNDRGVLRHHGLWIYGRDGHWKCKEQKALATEVRKI